MVGKAFILENPNKNLPATLQNGPRRQEVIGLFLLILQSQKGQSDSSATSGYSISSPPIPRDALLGIVNRTLNPFASHKGKEIVILKITA